MLKHFQLHHGYYEDESLACLLLVHDEGFETPLAAMESLASALKAHWRENNKPKACCAEAASGFRFCPTCGSSLDDDDYLEDQENSGAANLFMDLFAGSIQGKGRLLEDLEGAGWNLFGHDSRDLRAVTRVVGVAGWIDEERFMEATLPDLSTWSSLE